METPINLAHQQDRKAEALLIAGKHQDAIICHQKAADYLLDAMKMTSVPRALKSMELQHQKHLKEQKILNYKWERFKKLQEQLKKIDGTIENGKEADPSEINPSFDVTDCSQDVVNNCVEKGPECHKASDLHFFEQTESGNLVLSADHLSVFSISSVDSMTASIKDDKRTDLDLNTHDLEMQVLALSQSLEDANRENTRLRNILTRLVAVVRERFGVEIDPQNLGDDEEEDHTRTEENGVGDIICSEQVSFPVVQDVSDLPVLELPKYT